MTDYNNYQQMHYDILYGEKKEKDKKNKLYNLLFNNEYVLRNAPFPVVMKKTKEPQFRAFKHLLKITRNN